MAKCLTMNKRNSLYMDSLTSAGRSNICNCLIRIKIRSVSSANQPNLLRPFLAFQKILNLVDFVSISKQITSFSLFNSHGVWARGRKKTIIKIWLHLLWASINLQVSIDQSLKFSIWKSLRLAINSWWVALWNN